MSRVTEPDVEALIVAIFVLAFTATAVCGARVVDTVWPGGGWGVWAIYWGLIAWAMYRVGEATE